MTRATLDVAEEAPVNVKDVPASDKDVVADPTTLKDSEVALDAVTINAAAGLAAVSVITLPETGFAPNWATVATAGTPAGDQLPDVDHVPELAFAQVYCANVHLE